MNYDPEAKKEDGSCRYKEAAGDPPATYGFSDAELGRARIRVELLHRLVKEVEKGRNGSSISLQTLLDLYRNDGTIGNGEVDLVGTLSLADSAFFRNRLEEIANRSGDPNSLIAGRFVSPDSIAYVPLIKKGLMGASLFAFSCDHLLEDLDDASHAQPDASSATERERLYDEAFGLFGVPTDFSRSTPIGTDPYGPSKAWFWGAATLRTDPATGDLPGLFDSFVEGRWALSNEKTSRFRDAVQSVEEGWERIGGALLIRNIKRCIEAIDANQLGDRIRYWSKAHGTLLYLRSNSDGVIDNSEHQELRNKLGDSPNGCDVQSLNSALATLQNVYGFSNTSLQAL